MNSRWMIRVTSGFAIFMLVLAMGGVRMVAQTADSDEINRLLSDAKSEAVQLENDADMLQSYTMSPMSWETHAMKLHSMREHVNSMGKINQQLHDQRAEGSPWQQEAIDRISPLLRGMADKLTVTIKHLNDHKSQIQMQPYRDYTHSNYDLASRTTRMISDFVEYSQSKSRSEELEHRLELPSTSSN